MSTNRQSRAYARATVETHQCPGRHCKVQVSNDILACASHWGMLSTRTKALINATAGMNPLTPARREALAAARVEWRDEA